MQLSADAKLILSGIVNLAGNSVIIAALPALLPHTAVVVIFLVFNLAQVIYSFANPSYAVHLIQTGQMRVLMFLSFGIRFAQIQAVGRTGLFVAPRITPYAFDLKRKTLSTSHQ
jgi:hypothetical protein